MFKLNIYSIYSSFSALSVLGDAKEQPKALRVSRHSEQ